MSNDLLALSDYTMLDPEGDLDFFLSEASTQKFAAICVLPEHVQQARASYSGIIACAAGRFPNGDLPLHERIAEVKQAISEKADSCPEIP